MKRIIIDRDIPYIKGVFEPWAEVLYAPGSEITPSVTADADALIVRTRTKCNHRLLRGSRIKIVASATIGTDHLEIDWLEKNGIRWVNAPGCNANAVMQYVTALLFALSDRHSLVLPSLTLGIVGVGHTGAAVARTAESIGMRVLLNDPPRERREEKGRFSSLCEIVSESDIITLHVPLTSTGRDRTRDLIERQLFSRMKPGTILINTSRGEVVETGALQDVLSQQMIKGAALDVWRDEPAVDPALVAMVDIATPHIAGYSVDGKANATTVAVREVAATLSLPLAGWKAENLPQPADSLIDLTGEKSATTLNLVKKAVFSTYDIEADDHRFRRDIAGFENLRNNYGVRREFSFYRVKTDDKRAAAILAALGFSLF